VTNGPLGYATHRSRVRKFSPEFHRRCGVPFNVTAFFTYMASILDYEKKKIANNLAARTWLKTARKVEENVNSIDTVKL
jgi:hypothetical protein